MYRYGNQHDKADPDDASDTIIGRIEDHLTLTFVSTVSDLPSAVGVFEKPFVHSESH